MSDIIEWVLEMDVQAGQAPAYPDLIAEMVAATQADEPGALVYEYYTNENGSRVTVIERYTDSAAAMVHLGNFGAKFADRFLACFAPVRFTVYGPASDALRAALTPMGATFELRAVGFHR